MKRRASASTTDESRMSVQTGIFVAGHRGLVGSALVRALRARAARPSCCAPRRARPAGRRPPSAFFAAERPDYVFWPRRRSAASMANNTYPADFIRDNLMIQTNVIHAACRARRAQAAVPRLILHLSRAGAAADPRGVPADRPLEPTNEWYAIAKIAGIKMCQAYRRQYGFDVISRDADQPVRPRRQLRPAELPRAAGADPKIPRGQAARRCRRSSSGAPARRAASSCTWTTWPTPACIPDGATTGDRARQRRQRRGRHDRANWRAGRRGRRLPAAASRSTPASPTARRASCWMRARCTRSAGRRGSVSWMALRNAYAWFRAKCDDCFVVDRRKQKERGRRRSVRSGPHGTRCANTLDD